MPDVEVSAGRADGRTQTTRGRVALPHVPLFRDRPLGVQIVTGLVVPAVFGAITGVVLGVSAAGYWALQVLAVIGGILGGYEHRDGWEGADRGLVGGAVFGTAILVAHAVAGTDAQVTLPKFAPILAVFTAIIGMFLGALGGRLRRAALEREAPGSAPVES